MVRENKFLSLKIGVAIMAALVLLGFKEGGINPRLKQKLESAVQTTFELESYELQSLYVPKQVDENTPVSLQENTLFVIKANGKSIGYAYLGVAPSMKNVFDYVVLLNPDLSIKKSKVLIYREDYGRQIGSQRWLKQFIGKKAGETVTYGEDIDAISGATISAKSMTVAIGQVLKSMAILKEEKIL